MEIRERDRIARLTETVAAVRAAFSPASREA
jgi:hypothetical protein